MPQIQWRKEPKGKVYEDFIDEAVKRSDAFMLFIGKKIGAMMVTQEVLDSMGDGADSPFYKYGYNEPRMLAFVMRFDESCELIAEDARNNPRDIDAHKEFDAKCLPFFKKLEPFIIKQRHNPKWHCTQSWGPVDPQYIDINVYRCCEEIKPFLKEPGGLYEWLYPYYPEDLGFFKNNKCWFSSRSSEKYAFLYPDSYEDLRMWKEMGLEFMEASPEQLEREFKKDWPKESSYYEEYELPDLTE
ncbi:hypothetical protein LJB83_01600 [Clostridia bacterium OttesenSCG-928-F22]|nr:hypothetical protein [Clostridia bacterium OttesenSCG-928-F22]